MPPCPRDQEARDGRRRDRRNAHSKKFENHCHALALYFAAYNWIKIHTTLRIAPAMAAGLTTKLMGWEDLVSVIDEFEVRQKSN